MEDTYENAYSEVIGILENVPQNLYEKVPKKIVDNFRKNRNPNYVFKYNIYKDLDSQNVCTKAKTIIAILFRDYWATEEQRKKINEYDQNNRLIIEQAKREQFNPNDVFRKTTQVSNINNTDNTKKEEKSLVLKKETLISKIIKTIKSLFKK